MRRSQRIGIFALHVGAAIIVFFLFVMAAELTRQLESFVSSRHLPTNMWIDAVSLFERHSLGFFLILILSDLAICVLTVRRESRFVTLLLCPFIEIILAIFLFAVVVYAYLTSVY